MISRSRYMTSDVLTIPHVEELTRRLHEILDDEGWGTVTIYVERGKISWIGHETKQRMLDELMT